MLAIRVRQGAVECVLDLASCRLPAIGGLRKLPFN